MPSELKILQTNVFTGGMNSDIAPEHIPNDTYRYMLNCNVMSSAEGNVGVVTNVRGNVRVPVALPFGINKTIGVALDEESNNLYFAVWNSEGYHTWYRFNTVDKLVTRIIQSTTDTGDTDIFKWGERNLILHANIIDNNLLYWVQEGNPARKVNIAKCLDKSPAGYGPDIREIYTRAYKLTSVYAPQCNYITDETKKFNRLYGNLFKFSQRFIYDDGERSNWSDWSTVPLPDEEYFTGTKGVPLKNNGISIRLELGSPIVKRVELAMQSTNKEGGIFDWVSVITIDKDQAGASEDAYYEYIFYNDGAYHPIENQDTMLRHYSYLPRNPICQDFTENALVYSNFFEGFPVVDIDASATVRYDELFLDSGSEGKWNEPELTYTKIDEFYDANRRATSGEIYVGPDVKSGNIFTVDFYATRSGRPPQTLVLEAKANIADTPITVATSLANQLKAAPWSDYKYSYVTQVQTVPGGGAKFSFRHRVNHGYSYWKITTNAVPVNTETLKDTGQSVLNIKHGSSTKYAFIYEGEDEEQTLAFTSDSLIVDVATVNDLGKLMKPVVTININHKPPSWAKYYQIVRTKDLVYSKYIQLLIQKTVLIETSSGDKYVDLVIGSLFTYKKLHPNTTLTYEFKKGDRVRLVSNYNGEEWVISPKSKDFEIIDYQQSPIYKKLENVKVDGTNKVEVSSGSKDNIGNYIIIDGVERLIVDATESEYTLDRELSAGPNSPVTHPYYEIINRRGVIRIKYDDEYPIVADPESGEFPLIEVYEPSIGLSTISDSQFYKFGQKFPIIDWGTDSAAHSGNVSDQSATSPAIIEISDGTSYVRNRELPVTNQDIGPQVIISPIEDYSYSDFYVSDLNDNGRPTVLDIGTGVVHFGDRIRYSNNRIEGTSINGLNDFDNLNRRDYNDKYGDIKRLLFDEGRLYVFKYLKTAWVPVYGNLISDESGSNILARSSEILPKSLIYFLWDGGVGGNPESIYRNGNNIFFLSPTSGIMARIGGNGVEPISITYKLNKDMREHIRSATESNTLAIGGFNRKAGQYLLSIEPHDIVVYNASFDQNSWSIDDDPITDIGPSVDAGPSKEVSGTSVMLSGTVNQGTYPIESISWRIVSGPNVPIIVSPNQLVTEVINMVTGLYVFELKATDTQGMFATDTTEVRVAVGLRVYFGGKPSGDYPTYEDIMASTFSTFPTGGDIPVDFMMNSPLYYWIAYPVSEAEKTKWEDSREPLNRGNVGSPSDLFGPYTIINGYRVTITQYPTIFENEIIFKR